jgi:hypothetical protein
MTSSLPPLGYITFGNWFMLINYFVLALVLISTLALAYVDKKENEKAYRVYVIALAVVPVVCIDLQVVNFLLL